MLLAHCHSCIQLPQSSDQEHYKASYNRHARHIRPKRCQTQLQIHDYAALAAKTLHCILGHTSMLSLYAEAVLTNVCHLLYTKPGKVCQPTAEHSPAHNMLQVPPAYEPSRAHKPGMPAKAAHTALVLHCTLCT
jgi:hypothetical protein